MCGNRTGEATVRLPCRLYDSSSWRSDHRSLPLTTPLRSGTNQDSRLRLPRENARSADPPWRPEARDEDWNEARPDPPPILTRQPLLRRPRCCAPSPAGRVRWLRDARTSETPPPAHARESKNEAP